MCFKYDSSGVLLGYSNPFTFCNTGEISPPKKLHAANALDCYWNWNQYTCTLQSLAFSQNFKSGVQLRNVATTSHRCNNFQSSFKKYHICKDRNCSESSNSTVGAVICIFFFLQMIRNDFNLVQTANSVQFRRKIREWAGYLRTRETRRTRYAKGAFPRVACPPSFEVQLNSAQLQTSHDSTWSLYFWKREITKE